MVHVPPTLKRGCRDCGVSALCFVKVSRGFKHAERDSGPLVRAQIVCELCSRSGPVSGLHTEEGTAVTQAEQRWNASAFDKPEYVPVGMPRVLILPTEPEDGDQYIAASDERWSFQGGRWERRDV